jgi:hypothetical protein
MSVSGTPGTGTITLGSAASGYQSFSAAHGANATVDVLITDGTATHVALIITGSSTLLYGTTCTSQALTANGSNTVNVPAFDIEIADPA